MTEAEVLELLSEYATTSGTFLTMYVSFTFAYLTVAYFVGRSLSRFQCVVVSMLYITSGSLAGASAVAWAYAWETLKTGQTTLLDEVWLMKNFEWVELLAFLLLFLGLVSLYFMYDVRRNPISRNTSA